MRFISALLFLFFMFQINLLAQPPVASYGQLVHEVRAAFARGKERTADAVERERVQTNWEVGKLVDEHILLHKERAEYGKEVIKRLSADLSMSESELHRIVEFYRAYPILAMSRELSWGHYRELLAVNDSKKRAEVAEQAIRNKWSVADIRREIKKLKSENPKTVSDELKDEPLIPIQGTLNTYRIVSSIPPPVSSPTRGEENLQAVNFPLPFVGEGKGEGTELFIDLGFSNYTEIPGKYKKKFKQGDIIHSKNGKLELIRDATVGELFTYQARVLDVTDGDTLWLWVDLGFGFFTKQQVRLRGIDTPEIATRDGQAAKEFVEKELSFPHAFSGNPQSGSPIKTFGDDMSSVIITTSKSDKYDRYLADIYYVPARDVKISAGSEQYLNGRLLEEKLASRV